MDNLAGINITSQIVPLTEASVYPTHEAEYGFGGWRTVDEVSSLYDEITRERCQQGMAAYVFDEEEFYILKEFDFATDYRNWVKWDKEDRFNKSQPNGYASLDAWGKVPLSEISDVILGQMLYAGVFSPVPSGVNPTALLSANAMTFLNTTSTSITLSNDATSIGGYFTNMGNYFIAQTSGTFAGMDFDAGD